MAVSLHTTRSHIYSLYFIFNCCFTSLTFFAKPVFDFLLFCVKFHVIFSLIITNLSACSDLLPQPFSIILVLWSIVLNNKDIIVS